MENKIFTIIMFLATSLTVVMTGFSQTCLTAGCLDGTFGGSGTVITYNPPATTISPRESVVQSDGKILVVADAHNNTGVAYTSLIYRLQADGSLDTDFGAQGFVAMNWDAGTSRGVPSLIALQNVDGEDRIVVAGTTPSGRNTITRVERYLSNGAPDASFGTSGRTIVNVGAPGAIGIQPVDQKIILTSDAGTIVRLNQTGLPDGAFGSGGISKTASGVVGGSLVIQSTGRIVVGGRMATGSNSYFTLARYNSNGTFDDGGKNDTTKGDSFGTGGRLKPDFGGRTGTVFDMKQDSSGRIVAVGSVGGFSANDFAVVRLTANGQLDNSFSADGKLTHDFNGANDAPHSVVLQTDGKLVVGGEVNKKGADLDFGLIRLNTDGSFDPDFGQNGIVITEFPGGTMDDLMSLNIQADPNCGGCEKLVGVGWIRNPDGSTNAVAARYIP